MILVKASCRDPLWVDSTVIENGKYRLLNVPEQVRMYAKSAEKDISSKQVFGFSFARDQDSIYDIFEFKSAKDLMNVATDVWKRRDLVIDNIDSDEILQRCGNFSKELDKQSGVRTIIYNIDLDNISIVDGTFKSFNPETTVLNFMIPFKNILKSGIPFDLVHNLDNISNMCRDFTYMFTIDRHLNEDWFYNKYMLSREKVTVL